MKAFSIDVKRFKVPKEVEVTCPHCNAVNQIRFDGDLHLSYPKANTPFEYYTLCSECDEEMSFKLCLTVDLKVVK